MFYALETFCENLEDSIVPYLSALLERLFETLDPKNSTKLRELALQSVASTASAAKVNMLPYFPQLIEGLNMYFVKSDREDIVELRPQAIDTLATIARTIGKENFAPITNNTMNFALNFLSEIKNDEPELRRSLYNLFAALSEVVGSEMASVLPQIVERMLDSVKSSEETVVDYKNNEGGNIIDKIKYDQENNADDIDIENSDEEDEDDDDVCKYQIVITLCLVDLNGIFMNPLFLSTVYSVENAYLDEKEQAIIALRLLAEFTGYVIHSPPLVFGDEFNINLNIFPQPTICSIHSALLRNHLQKIGSSSGMHSQGSNRNPCTIWYFPLPTERRGWCPKTDRNYHTEVRRNIEN